MDESQFIPKANTAPELRPEQRLTGEELANFHEKPTIYASTVSTLPPEEDPYNKPHSVLLSEREPRYFQGTYRAGNTYYVISFRTGRFHEMYLSDDIMREWRILDGVDRIHLKDGDYFLSQRSGLYHKIYVDEEGIEKVEAGVKIEEA